MKISLFELVTENPPSWAHSTIKDWNDVFDRCGAADIMDFVTREVSEGKAQVDMRQVVGQWEHYAGQTWLEAATSPKYKPHKMRTVFDMYDKNPDYYFSGEVENGICLSSLNGGPWFSDSGGNHRTIVAKFACEQKFRETGVYPLVSGVSKHYYVADVEAFDLFGQLRGFVDQGIHVSVQRQRLKNSGLQRNMTIEYELVFNVADYRFGRNGRHQCLSVDEFRRYAQHIIRRSAEVTRLERMKHYWLQFGPGDFDSLIY